MELPLLMPAVNYMRYDNTTQTKTQGITDTDMDCMIYITRYKGLVQLYLALFGNDVISYDALEMLVYVYKCRQVVRLVADVIDLQAHAVSHANHDVTPIMNLLMQGFHLPH